MSELKIRDHRDVILRPVVSEKSYNLLDENKYTFIVAPHDYIYEYESTYESHYAKWSLK